MTPGRLESDIQSHDWGQYLSEIQTEQRRRKLVSTGHESLNA